MDVHYVAVDSLQVVNVMGYFNGICLERVWAASIMFDMLKCINATLQWLCTEMPETQNPTLHADKIRT